MYPNQEHYGIGDNVGRDKIEYHFHEETVYVPRDLNGLPYMEDDIIGREEELKELESMFGYGSGPVLINGMGGIGKSTLAFEYANQHLYDYQHIACVETSGNFITDLTSQKLLLANLGISSFTGSPEENVQLILNSFSKLQEKSLLIIDNADEQLIQFKKYLPKEWHVLITSRHDLGFKNTLMLDFLSKEDSLKLFYAHYRWERDDETVDAILNYVGYHTLSIELLAKTAQLRHIKNIKEIRKALEKNGLQIGRIANFTTLHSREEKIDRIFSYLCKVFELNDNHLNDNEKLWLRRLSMLPPIFTSFEMIAKLFEIKEENTEAWDNYTATLASLHEKGWLLYDAKDDAYKMHQIIQEVARHYMPIVVVELNTLLKIMTDLVTVNTETKDIVERFVFIPYAEHLLRLVTDEKQEIVMELRCWLGFLYQYQGNYKRSKELLETAVHNSESVFEPNHYNIGLYKNNLGGILRLIGEYRAAAHYLEQALDIITQQKGELHSDIATTQSNLANVYSDLNEYERARDLLEKALALDLKNFGKNHPKIALRQSNLASLYTQLGEYERARDLLEKALENALINFSEVHPQVALYQSNLGLVNRNLNNYERALDLLEKALVSDVKNFGEGHPNVATRYNNIALVYADQKQWEKAKELFEKAYVIYSKLLSLDHPHTKMVKESLDYVTQQLE